jgi:hypothetical protein
VDILTIQPTDRRPDKGAVTTMSSQASSAQAEAKSGVAVRVERFVH